MSFDELQQLATPPVTATPAEPEPEPAPEPEQPAPIASSLWDEPAVSPFDAPDDAPLAGGQTQAFPAVSFDDLQQQMSVPAPEPAPEPALETLPEPLPEPEASPWDEQPAFGGGETQAFPTMSYEELAASAAPEPEPAPWEQPSEPAEPIEAAPVDEEPLAPPPAFAPDTPAIPIRGSDLSDEQVDRIARRVVELMSDQVIRNIAWEVIPDLAEMVVKERIRQLESEA
jgi:hypothetical protein